jgi:hypothetical protein
MMDNINSNTISLFAPYYETDNTPFIMKIGGTTYEVSTHFSTKGKETVLQQFKDLLIELDLV